MKSISVRLRNDHSKHFKRTIKNKKLRKLIGQRELLIMSIPFLIYVFIFKYLPIWGWIMAFQFYVPGKSIFDQKWVGLKQFKLLFSDENFWQILRNTMAMSLISLVLGFVTAIGLALLINELTGKKFKKTIQTVSYLPHFVSMVVVASLVQLALSPEDGIINNVLLHIGMIKEPIHWLAKGKYFWWINGLTHVWKEVGWNSIIYLAAITAIDRTLYESASVDGAGRFRKMWHITLPGIKPTFIILLIMNMGFLLEMGFELQYLLRNPLIVDYSEVIQTYVLEYGIRQGNFSFASAAGIFQSVISVILVLSANLIAKKFGETRLV